MNRYEKLLEVYTLEQILEQIELEPVELLGLLDEQGYFEHYDILEPL